MNKKRCLAIMVAAVLFLASSCEPANHQPTINSLEAEGDWTTPSGSLQVTCTATDPDGDELSYEWSVNGGNITGTGAVVNWTAPQEVGVYDITVVVKDGYGGSATKTLPIVVTVQPPIIEDLLVTKDRYGHCYLLAYSWGYKVGKGQKYDIECIASNTSGEPVYDWSCDDGEISGEGSMITWIAPNKTSVEVTVMVIVSDVAGNRVGKSIVFRVPSCTCGF